MLQLASFTWLLLSLLQLVVNATRVPPRPMAVGRSLAQRSTAWQRPLSDAGASTPCALHDLVDYGTRRTRGNCTATAWQLRSNCMANAWQWQGKRVATAWHLHGKRAATAWQIARRGWLFGLFTTASNSWIIGEAELVSRRLAIAGIPNGKNPTMYEVLGHSARKCHALCCRCLDALRPGSAVAPAERLHGNC